MLFRFFVRRMLDRFERRYDYDVSYMRAMLDASPKALRRFSALMQAAQHREAAPIEAYFAAKLIGALYEDCGPCTQLVVNLAREAGVKDAEIEAVLRRDFAAMSDAAALGFRYAEAVTHRLASEHELREAVRAQWGEEGLIDLAFALQFSRMFPMLKAALGYAEQCRRVRVGDAPVEVVRRAA